MGSLNVVQVPISLVPLGEGNDVKVVAYRPERWLESAGISDEPTEIAGQLLQQTPGLDPELVSQSEPVGFLTGGGTTRLVFTAPIPMAATLRIAADEQSAAWCSLAPGQAELGVDEVQSSVLNHWRQALTETTAAFDLLPRYFTTSQVRSIYATVWGDTRDWSNFHRWLHTSNSGICREVPPKEVMRDVSQQVDVALGAGLAAGSLAYIALEDMAMRKPAIRATSRLVGTSPTALGPAAAFAPVVVAAAVAGGVIAYQRQVTRGKAPAWFTRTDPRRVVLTEPYTPRPEWLRPYQPADG